MRLTFKEKKHETGNIWSFFFYPKEKINWIPGQYLNLTMPDVPPVFADRLFTIASAPYEKHIQITTFIGESPFKQKLASLEVGAEVEADQVGGDFTLHLDHTPDKFTKRLFLAGGLGITPFRSMVAQMAHNGEPLNTSLLWSGRDEQCPFVDELNEYCTQDKTFEVQRFTSQRITPAKIKELINDLDERVIYLAGSQDFVESIGDGLMKLGTPRSQLKYDWFDGYTGTLV